MWVGPVVSDQQKDEKRAVEESGRLFWHSSQLNDKTLTRDDRKQCSPDDANLVSSLTRSGTHMPAIDIDHPALLVPSSTPGHSHLFIDSQMSWRSYRKLLKALYKSGVIGRNAYWRSLDRGASFVRPPGVFKTATELDRSTDGRAASREAAEIALRSAKRRVRLRLCLWHAQEVLSLTGRRPGKDSA
jgi:hypothetical protein